MPRPPRPAPTTSQASHRTNGVDHPIQALATLVRLLARQAARDLVSETVPGASPEHAANDKEHRHGAHNKQDR